MTEYDEDIFFSLLYVQGNVLDSLKIALHFSSVYVNQICLALLIDVPSQLSEAHEQAHSGPFNPLVYLCASQNKNHVYYTITTLSDLHQINATLAAVREVLHQARSMPKPLKTRLLTTP